MKININKKRFYIYLIAFLGFILVLYYIWFRFIRERLPRDIPFILSVPSFVGLCFICSLYVYKLYRIYKPLTSQSFVYLFRQPLLLVFKPFYFFDKIIKKNNYFNDLIFIFYFKIILIFKPYKGKNDLYFYFACIIFPRMLLLLAFILDIFYFHKLSLFYYFIFISIIPLMFYYSIYSLTQYLEIITKILNKNYYVKILSTVEEEEEYEKQFDTMAHAVSINSLKLADVDDFEYNSVHADYFILCQSVNLILDYVLYKYTCIETWFARDKYIKKHNMPEPAIWIYTVESDDISKALAKEFRELMPRAYYFKAFLDNYNDYLKKHFIKYDKYFVTIYLICWMYILVISIHTLNIKDLIEILKTIKTPEDPFGLTIQNCLDTCTEYENKHK